MGSLKKRGKVYYAQYYIGGKAYRKSLDTTSVQIAKEKLRQIESRIARGDDLPIPTRTPIVAIVQEYILHIKQHKTRSAVRSDLYYLRQLFGEACPELRLKLKGSTPTPLQVAYIEDITAETVSQFIHRKVAAEKLAPKTANRYREILHTLFNWAMRERGVRTLAGRNPVAQVKRYREPAPNIVFMTLEQIDEQLKVVELHPTLQAMVATFIFAGLRREEALWLQPRDVCLVVSGQSQIRVSAKVYHGQPWQPKTKSNRVVPISNALYYRLANANLGPASRDWFFTTPNGHRWDPDNFSATLRRLNSAAKLPWNCAVYRHTFGSQLAIKGVSLLKIAELMGNSPEVCRRHYAGLSLDSLTTCVDFEDGPASPVNLLS